MNETISVIIPVYNVEKYLPECLDSVMAQTWRDIEVLLVDDGSTDGSGAICEAYAARDKRFQVIHQENAGVSAARNLGLDEAKGAYISFVDSDDVIAPEFLKTLHDALFESRAQIAACGYLRFADGEPRNMQTEPGGNIIWTRNEVLRELTRTSENRRGEFVTIMCNKLYLRSVFDGKRFPLGTRYEDEYIIHHLLMGIGSFCKCPQTLYFYRQHGASFMNRNTSGDLRWMQMLGAYSERCELLSGAEYRDIYANVVTNYFETMAYEALTDGLATGQFFTVYRRYLREMLRYGRWLRGKRFWGFAVNPYWFWKKHIEDDKKIR